MAVRIAPAIASIGVDLSKVDIKKSKELVSKMLQAYQRLKATK